MPSKHRDFHRAPNGQFLRPPHARGFYASKDDPLLALSRELQGPEDAFLVTSPAPESQSVSPARPYRLR
jgi:hypothetical protein